MNNLLAHMSATALKRTSSKVFSCAQFFWVHFTLKHPLGHIQQNRFKFIKKRLQNRCFTVNSAKLLKVLCRTSPVSVSNFNSTFLTLRPRQTYIYVFQTLLFWIFLSHVMFLVEARNKFIWFYKFIWF